MAARDRRPATRIGNHVCFTGGFHRDLTYRERFALWLHARGLRSAVYLKARANG